MAHRSNLQGEIRTDGGVRDECHPAVASDSSCELRVASCELRVDRLSAKSHPHADLHRPAWPKVRSAERIAEVVGPAAVGDVEQTHSHAEVSVAASHDAFGKCG